MGQTDYLCARCVVAIVFLEVCRLPPKQPPPFPTACLVNAIANIAASFRCALRRQRRTTFEPATSVIRKTTVDANAQRCNNLSPNGSGTGAFQRRLHAGQFYFDQTASSPFLGRCVVVVVVEELGGSLGSTCASSEKGRRDNAVVGIRLSSSLSFCGALSFILGIGHDLCNGHHASHLFGWRMANEYQCFLGSTKMLVDVKHRL